MAGIKDRVAIIGMGCSKCGERWDSSADDLIVESAYEAYEDAGVGPEDIQAGWIAFTTTSRTGESLTYPLKLQYIPATHVENACGSGMDAFRQGCYAVAAGIYDLVLIQGMEKLKDSALSGVPRPGGMGYWHPVYRAGMSAPAYFAIAATKYFHRYGLSSEEGKKLLAMIAVKNHRNGTLSPKAHFQNEVSLEQVMNAPMVAWPLGLFDCCPTTDGAATAIITRPELAKNYRDDYVLVKALGLATGPGTGRIGTDYDFTCWQEPVTASERAYGEAGVKNPRKELDIAQIHDCFSIAELIEYECLGFCGRGEAKEDIIAGSFALDGDLPVNTDGGLKSFGHPVGATGLRMLYENYKQLQGKADKRQVKNVNMTLAHTLGGHPGAFTSFVAMLGR